MTGGHRDRLLLWLDDRTRRSPAYVDVARFVREFRLDEDPALLALELDQEGLARIVRSLGSTTEVRLTDSGRVAARRLKDLRKDRAARLRHTADALIRWLYDFDGDRTPIDPTRFLTTAGHSFAGTDTTRADLHEALAHLAEHRLLDRLPTEPPTVRLTPQGARCALAGGNVQEHLDRPRPGTTYNTFMPNAKGVVIGEQHHFTQHNTEGVDPTLFARLAGYVGQVSGTLDLPDTDRADLERVARDLQEEAASETPDPGRLRRLTARMKEMLVQAGTTAAATVGVQMAEQALSALG
ncbi:hypothetical protein [Streptomyces sp. NPDC097619]|uniref:hypothetical protein n=1 Tax=Streptomyces sp. NPDC097619 TaxID=3157228 RepID=UPI003325A694